MDEDRERPKPAAGPPSERRDVDAREARLAAALRANLRRRKAASPKPHPSVKG
jgi:hypothetical protein